jgi:hypothetical protein
MHLLRVQHLAVERVAAQECDELGEGGVDQRGRQGGDVRLQEGVLVVLLLRGGAWCRTQ